MKYFQKDSFLYFRLLHVEPSQRLNIVDVLTHPWLEEAPATELSSPGIMLDKVGNFSFLV